ncbi:DMT family transporter [Palaeococcus pacificus]|nr:EamA family transporter [Palaeococcus pacificus]
MSMIEGVLLALMAAFGWGLSSVFVKMGMKNKQAVSVNIVRLYFVSFLYAAIFLLTGSFEEILSLSSKQLLIAFISGQFGFVVGDYFFFNALKIAGVSRTVPVTSSYPLWAILWAVLFLGRSITAQIIIGALLIFAAIVLVRQTEEEEHTNPKGLIFAILAPISWSLAITTLDYLSSQISPLTLAGLRMMFATVGISFFIPRYKEELKSFTLKEFGVVSAAALFGLLIGQYAFVRAVGTIGSQIATPITAINPIISSTLAIAFLKEPPNRKIILSLILAVLGIVIISLA